MEYRPLKPKESPKVRKIVYIDEAALSESLGETDTIEWLADHFDAYLIEAEGFIHLLRGDYLISPIQHTPPFHGEWISFRIKDTKGDEKPQTDWQRVRDYFADIVQRNENMGAADYDMTVLAMLRSQMRYDEENT